MLQLVVKNDNPTSRESSRSQPLSSLRLVVSRSERETRINRIDLADRLAMEWRQSFLPTADQAPLGSSQVVQLFDRPARLQLLPTLDEPITSR